MASVGLRLWPSAQDFRGLLVEPAGEARGGDFRAALKLPAVNGRSWP